MNPLMNLFPEGQIIAYALIFLRIVAFVVAMPVIGTPSVPVVVKILFSLVIAILLGPVLKFQNAELIQVGEQVILLAMRELFIGLFLGYLMRLFFFCISIAGEIIGVSSGVASAQLFNPAMGTQSNVMEQFYLIVATLFFFGLNGHHIFLQGLAKSFEILPLAKTTLNTEGFATISQSFQTILTLGVRLGAPVMISILLTNLAMGVVGRAVPQMNVLVTSLQVTFLITLLVLLITIPFFLDEMGMVLNQMAKHFMSAMQVL